MSGKVRCYTDGACSGNPGPGGWAAAIAFPEYQKVISGGAYETTNNRMELQAVVEALAWISKRIVDVKRVEIVSDSNYVVKAFNSGWLRRWKANGWITSRKTSVSNKDLWIQADDIVSNFKQQSVDVRFIKVKGHSGNPMNEKVDRLAVKEIGSFK